MQTIHKIDFKEIHKKLMIEKYQKMQNKLIGEVIIVDQMEKDIKVLIVIIVINVVILEVNAGKALQILQKVKKKFLIKVQVKEKIH